MNFEDFTKDQQKAIVQKGSNIIVSAGAGSGKTAVLTQRVLNFIENEGLHLDEFLILTFTNLAAGEMKDRIRSALTEKGLEDASLVDVADITTFDAYALSIVKKYHTLLNVSPKVSIIDSNIISVKKRNIIKDIFEEYYTSNDEAFKKLISSFCFKDDDIIQELVLKLHNASCLEMDSEEYLNTFIEKYYNNEMIKSHIDYYVEVIKEKRNNLINELNGLPNVRISKSNPDGFVDTCNEVCKVFFTSDSYDMLVSSLNDVKLPICYGLEKEDKESIDKFKKSYDKVKKYLNKLPQSEEEFFDYFKVLVPHIELIINITKRVERELRKYKDERSVYEFQDIAKMALELFRARPDISNEIRNKLKMIMIDEYQDTSLIQETFIAQISNNNVYMVGDIKQSIYRFRNAVSDIFKDKYSSYSNQDGGVSIDLNKNFRSRKEVLDDINYIFKQIMSLDMGGADYRASHVIEYGYLDYITKGSSEQNNNSTFILYDEDVENSVETEIRIIARDIISKKINSYQVFDKKKKKLRPCNFSDFCILLDRGTSFDDYVRIFNEYHIPLFVENDENIANNVVVKVLTSILKLIKCIMNNDYRSKEFIHAYLSIARSFIYNYSDQQLYDISKTREYSNDKVVIDFKNIILSNKDLPAYDIFIKVIFDLNIYNSFIALGDVKKNASYLDMFLDVFKQMHELDYTIDDFITYLKHIDTYHLKINLPSSGSDSDSVKLMNIHKSKGLEFPLVYFAGLTKNYNREALKTKYGISSKFGLYFPTFNEKENIIKTRNASFEAGEDSSEKIRLFYVALTRTKEKMTFVLPSSTYNSNMYLLNRSKAKEIYNTNPSFEDVFYMFINRDINYATFVLLTKLLNKKLPYTFINSCNKYEYTLDKLEDDFKREECYIKDALKLINDFRNDIIDKADIDAFIAQDTILSNLIKWDSIAGMILDDSELIVDIMKEFTDVTIEELFDDMVNGIIDMDEFEDKANVLVGGLSIEFYNVKDFNDISWDDKFIKNKFDAKDIKIVLQELFIYALTNKVNITSIKYVLTLLGYTLNEEYYSMLEGTHVNYSDVITLDCVNVLINYSPKESLGTSACSSTTIDTNIYEAYRFKNGVNVYHDALNSLFISFKDNSIAKDKFIEYISLLGYEPSIHFSTSDNPSSLYLYDAIVRRGYDYEIESLSFKELIEPFISYDKFNREYADLETKCPELKFEESTQRAHYDIRELNIDVKEVYIHKASKDIDISASYKNLEFGTKIHYLLELLDFKNPDYSFIDDEFYTSIVYKFMSSSLMKNINDGNIYKEYEYIDTSSETRGVIDLMVVYDDHIDIIDYKTKHIDDDGYNKQLKQYRSYIEKKFKKKIKTYLYSLLTGDIKEVL